MNLKSIAKRHKVSQSNISMLLSGQGINARKTMNIRLAEDLCKLTSRPLKDFLSPRILRLMKSRLWQEPKREKKILRIINGQ